MSTSFFDQQALRFLQTANQLLPDEGPKVIPLVFDFTAFDTYTLDYEQMQQRGFISLVQSIYVDNADNTAALTITVPRSGHRIIVPAHYQGFYPVFVPNPILITFESAGGPNGVRVFVSNFPMAPQTWSTI